jgi:DNA-binding SARP family transcriptional activator
MRQPPRVVHPLSVLALGSLRVFVGDRELPPGPWENGRAQLAFKYFLAREPGTAVPKEELLAAVWPDEDPARSRQGLRRAIWALRRTLEPDLRSKVPSSYVLSTEGGYVLMLGEGGRYDVEDFTRAVSVAAELERGGDGRRAADADRTAISLYRGHFLDNERYVPWTKPRREHLRDLFTEAVVRLGTYELTRGEVLYAIDLALRALELEPGSRAAYRLLVTGYARSNMWGRMSALCDRYRSRLLADGQVPPATLRDFLCEFGVPVGASRMQ